jgi:hypothetical protein
MISAGIGYLSLGDPVSGDADFVRFDMLEAMPAETLSEAIRVVSLPKPLVIRINGGMQEAVIALA